MNKHKRRKQYCKYILMRWKAHKHVSLIWDMCRLKDWYRLIEIIKRGNYSWFEAGWHIKNRKSIKSVLTKIKSRKNGKSVVKVVDFDQFR